MSSPSPGDPHGASAGIDAASHLERSSVRTSGHVSATSGAHREHAVHFYESDDHLSRAVARYLAEGARAGDALLVIATGDHWRTIRRRLESTHPEIDPRTVRVLDAGATLDAFVRNGEPDSALFDQVVGGAITNLLVGARRLRAYGEMVDVLWRAGERGAAIRLEGLWNELQQRHPFRLFCAYSMASFYKQPADLERVIESHGRVVIDDPHGEENGSSLATSARRLAAETARRRELEDALRDSLATRDETIVRGGKLLRITAAIAHAVTDEEVFAALVDDVSEAVGASSAGLWLLDSSGDVARLVRARGYQDEIVKSLDELAVEREPRIPVLDCIRERDAIWIDSQANLLERYPHLSSYTTRGRDYSVSCLPLVSDGRVLGALGITIEGAEGMREERRDFLRLVALYASQAVARLRLYRETLESRVRAEQLYRFAQSVVAADRVDVVYEAALSSIEAALSAKRAAILTFDDDGVLRFRAWRNLSAEYRAAVEGHSPWPPDATAPEPVLVPDAAHDPDLAGYRDLFASEGIGALAFIPIVSRQRLLGKFMVYHERRHEFDSNEIETARAIANHLGSVMTRFAVIARLQETIRSNELFAGALAHDLRNPLGAMMTAAKVALMQREGEDSRQDRDPRPLSRILSSGRRVANMIDQLLDFTRARSGGGIQIDPRESNLADLCAQAIDELELGHPEWRVRRVEQGDLSGVWDADRLLQVISNLVANAGQHGTPGGEVEVTLDGTHVDVLELRVHNDGAIPGKLLPHLFDPFRGARHRHDRSQGLGLGLFIVREIVRAHGGDVNVHSTEAEGTTLRVTLPREPARKPHGDSPLASPALG